MKKLFSILFVAVSITMVAQESALLRLNYEKGDQFLTKTRLKQDMRPVMNTDSTFDIITNVKNVESNGYQLEMSIEKMSMDMGMMKYDSSIKEENMNMITKKIHQKMQPILAMVIGVTSSKRGKLSDIKILKGQGDKNQITRALSFIEFPEKAVKVGSKWTQNITQEILTLTYNYTVTEITSEKVFIDINGKSTTTAKGSITGKLEVDRKTGISLKSVLKLNINSDGQELKTDILITMKKM